MSPKEDIKKLGDQGYILHIDKSGITIASRTIEGLSYGATTLSQIAAGRSMLPAIHICDWPSMKYRGVEQDICRGQVPTMATFKRLTDVIVDAKMNMMQLYMEHTFKWKSHPDISPPEGISPQEAREISGYASERHERCRQTQENPHWPAQGVCTAACRFPDRT